MKKQILFILSAFILLNASAQKFDQLAKTPPMGWNSWDCFGMDVTESEMKASADYMAKNLKKFGWNYVVLDMGWNFGEGLNTWNYKKKNPPQVMDEYGRLVPNIRKFPSSAEGKGLKPLADYVHSLGLTFGIHIMRGVPWQAVEKDIRIKGTSIGLKSIATEVNKCSWFNGMLPIDMTKPGAQEYYDSLVEMYAEWGVDYIKADDMLKDPYHSQEIEAMQNAIKKVGRPIVLSLSPQVVSVENADHLRKNANLWRISGDMWDHWSFIKQAFAYCRIWQNYITPNHWPDCDMLPLGRLRINGTDGMLAKAVNLEREKTVNEYSRLTCDEQYTLVTLWSIFRSPLMMGGNLLDMDKHTNQLITNKEVIKLNQNSKNNRELKATDNEIIWVADDPVSGAKYIALFNVGDDTPMNIKVTWEELNISGKYTVRDLWKKKNLGRFNTSFERIVPPHGVSLVKIFK